MYIKAAAICAMALAAVARADDVATLRANGWLPNWGEARYPDVIRRRTSTSPDRLYFGWRDSASGATHTVWVPWVVGLTPLSAAQYARQGLTHSADIPLTLCDRAFLWSNSTEGKLKACAEVYAATTATSGAFYAQPNTAAAKVGSAPKGASCMRWLYQSAVAGTQSLHWFRGFAPDTQQPGYIRCRDMSG